MNINWLTRRDIGRPVAFLLLAAALALGGLLARREFLRDEIPSWLLRSVILQWVALGVAIIAVSVYLVVSRVDRRAG